MSRILLRLRVLVALALIGWPLVMAAPGRGAAAAAEPPPPPAASVVPPLTGSDVGAFIDGLIPYALRRGDVAGATVVVVKDGQVLFEKGYGLADVGARRPVDPETTLFRVGSTSKLMTWTAVMQLVEAHRLDLDRDVNAYLDFRIPDRFGRPITLRDLMTHSAGFEDVYKQLMTPDRASTPSLEQYVKAHLPTRIYRPGSVVAYSNYGATLAGYIVQRVSGERFETYVQRHIFAPLGMRHSTFEQPVPHGLMLATGYKRASSGPAPFEYAGDVPAGALSTSARDMARFMIAHLADGAGERSRILHPETAQLMHAPAYRPLAPLNAMALGFYEESRNGHRIIGHAGDLITFHADFHLMPAEHVGLFIAMNSWGANDASSAIRTALFRGFVDRYFPAPIPAEATVGTAHQHGAMISGRYANSRQAVDSFASLAALLGQAVLTRNPDDTVSFSAFVDEQGNPKKWHEVAPFVWREVGGRARLAAKVQNGQVVSIATDDIPPIEEFQPVDPWHSGAWAIPLLGVAFLILLIACVTWLVRWIAGLVRRAGRAPVFPGPWSRMVRATIVANLLFLTGWAVVILASAENPAMLGPQLDPLLRMIQLLGVLGMLGLVPTIARTVRTWRDPAMRWTGRVASVLLLFACMATGWLALAFHLLTFGLNY